VNSGERRKFKRLLQQAGLKLSGPEPPTTTTPKTTPPEKLPWKEIPNWIYAVVTVGVTFLGAFLALYPWISVQLGDSLDISNPYATQFNISNEGYIPLTELDAKCVFNFDTTTIHAENNSNTVRDFVHSLWHSDKATIPCNLHILGRAATPFIFRDANLSFEIQYAFWHLNLKRLRRTQRFSFVAVHGYDGLMHWQYQKE
jgi:hypothetical protein